MKEKEAVKKVFSKSSEAYITSTTHAKGDDLLLMKEWLEPQSHMVVLDIATGGGHVAKHLSPYVKQVFATDITKKMLETTANHLQDYRNIEYLIADAENLPFLDSTFDIVTCRIAPHHFPDPNQFIKEVYRVLRPDGKFLFIDNTAPENNHFDQFINHLEKTRDYSHVRSHKISEWKQILKNHSFMVMKERASKKTLPFNEWVSRTLDSDRERKKVATMLLSASEEIKQYYEVKVKDGLLFSFAIDEWRALCSKHRN